MKITAIAITALCVAVPACAGHFMDPCPGTLLPPAQFDHQARPQPIYRLVDDVTYSCREELGLVTIWSLYACNGWKNQRWYIFLDKHRTPNELRCDVRHEYGHQNEIDAGVSLEDDAWHVGWERGQ